jgi:hypothetical protein
MSWCLPNLGLLTRVCFLLEISFRQLQVCNFVAPSPTRVRVCKLLYNCFWALPEQSLLGRSPAELTALFSVSSETPYNFFWALPEQSLLGRSPAELTALFYWLIWDSTNLEGQVPVFRSHASAVRNFQYYHWEGCMVSMQCNVEFGYQLSICSGTKENHGKPWSILPVAVPSECNWLLASSPALNPRTLTLVHTLCYCIFFSVFSFFHNKLFCFYNYLYVHMILISKKPYKTLMEGIKAYVYKHAYKHTYICTRLQFGNQMFYEVCCLSNNRDYVLYLIHFTGWRFTFFYIT